MYLWPKRKLTPSCAVIIQSSLLLHFELKRSSRLLAVTSSDTPTGLVTSVSRRSPARMLWLRRVPSQVKGMLMPLLGALAAAARLWASSLPHAVLRPIPPKSITFTAWFFLLKSLLRLSRRSRSVVM